MMSVRYLPLWITAALLCLLFGIGGWQFDGFASLAVVSNLFSDNAFLLIVALGMTLVIISGGIDLSVGAVIALGGDGTSRDVAIGWPDAPLIAISTGTNNVYPSAIDGTSAGAAAAFVATGVVNMSDVGRRSKRVVVRVDDGDKSIDDLALVDLALINSMFTGARAVRDPNTVKAVIAAVATPASTGLSSIAGRIHPVGRWDACGVFVRLGEGGRKVRVPLAPGSFITMEIAEVRPLELGEEITMTGKTILAFDGERDLPVSADGVVTARVEASGPLLIDVEKTLVIAAQSQMFDEQARHVTSKDLHTSPEEN